MEISCATDVPILVSPMYCRRLMRRRLMPESKLEFAAQVVVDPKFHGSLEVLLLLTVGWLCLYSCPSLSQPFAIGYRHLASPQAPAQAVDSGLSEGHAEDGG